VATVVVSYVKLLEGASETREGFLPLSTIRVSETAGGGGGGGGRGGGWLKSYYW